MRFVVLLFLLQYAVHGQRILYNSDLDKSGQAAAAAAKAIASDTITAKEMANLALIEKDQIDGTLAAGLVTARREVETLSTWKSVQKSSNFICGLILDDPLREWGVSKADILLKRSANGDTDCAVFSELMKGRASTALDDQKKEIEARKALLQKQLDELKKSSKQDPPSLNSVISQLSNAKDITDFVASLGKSGLSPNAKNASSALAPIIDGLKELNQLIDTATNIWKTQEGVSVAPGTLAPSKEETQLAMLSEDVQYLKDLMLIRSRRSLDDAVFLDSLRDVLPKIDDLISKGKLDLTLDIRADLADLAQKSRTAATTAERKQTNEDLQSKLDILYATGSIFAQNNMASNVALLREAIAWRRHQIRAHSLYNGTYEKTIQIATQRLADYYAAGFKPSQIAQLIHDLAAAVSLPKIAF